jgi:CRISPR/Cas system CSM-associated protein Csm3 (group 7 of RAMP superfamily)
MARGAKFTLARVTLELDTAARVGSGRADDFEDAVFAVDANDLPTLPGTTLAGIWRAACPQALQNVVFGFPNGDNGSPSALEVSFAHLHGQDNRPVPFTGARIDGDPVLRMGQVGVRRDHVAINQRGVAKDFHKYVERLVPAGARFTFEVVLHHTEAGVTLEQALGWLNGAQIRLGGGSRRGLGRFHVVSARGRDFDLTKNADWCDFAAYRRDLSEDAPQLTRTITPAKAESAWRTGTLILEPEDFWMFGGGIPTLPGQVNGERPVDQVPVRERQIVWANNRGAVQETWLAPGAGLKGAIAHRALFHALVQRGLWQTTPGAIPAVPKEYTALFGAAKSGNKDESLEDPSERAGIWLVSDGRIEDERFGRIDHVSLDRFTQGPLDGQLFDEAPLYKGRITFEVAIDVTRLETANTSVDDQLTPLRKAFEDLCRGRLAFGGGTGRGHGFAKGKWASANPFANGSTK